MIASAQGGMSIEDVARDSPEAILKDGIDIEVGMTDKQATRMAERLGLQGYSIKQVQSQQLGDLFGFQFFCEQLGRFISFDRRTLQPWDNITWRELTNLYLQSWFNSYVQQRLTGIS